MYKREQTLSYARALRSIHLFLPPLKGDQFHAYLTAQAQNAFPGLFFLTYQACFAISSFVFAPAEGRPILRLPNSSGTKCCP